MSPRRLLTFLFLANLLIYIARYLLAGVLPSVGRAFPKTSQAELGALASVFVAAYLISAPIFGALGDRFPRRRLLAFGAALSALATVAVTWVTSLNELFATRILLGVGESAFVTVAPTLVADAYPPARRAGAISVLTTAQPVGTALSYLITGLLVGVGLSWRSPFWIIAIPFLLSSLGMLRLPTLPRGALDLGEAEGLDHHRPPANAADQRTSLGHRYARLLATPSYLLDTLAMSANSFAMGGLAYWMPTYLHRARGVSMATADIAFGSITATMGAAGTLSGGAIAGRLAARRETALAWVAGIAAIAAVPLFYLWFHVHTPVALWGIMALTEFLLFIPPGPANTLLLNVTEPAVRGVGVALNIVLMHLLGEMLSPAIIGFFADRANMTRGIEVAAWAIGVSGLLWIATTFFIRRDLLRVAEALQQEVLRARP